MSPFPLGQYKHFDLKVEVQLLQVIQYEISVNPYFDNTSNFLSQIIGVYATLKELRSLRLWVEEVLRSSTTTLTIKAWRVQPKETSTECSTAKSQMKKL